MADNIEKIISVKFDALQAINGLKSLNGAIDTNETRLKKMAKAGEKGTQAYAILEQQTKSLRKQKQDLSQAVQNEIKQQNMLDGSLRSMRAQLSTLTKQYDALKREERENDNVGGKLKTQINAITKELKRAEEGTERYYRNVGNYKNAILDTIGANTMFGSSLTNIVTNIVNIEGGFKGAMAAMGNSVKAFSASLEALLNNPVFLTVAGIAGAGVAFKWWYDYNDGLAEATRLTREFTGLTGKELSDLRDGIQATADTYGKDYKDVLVSVDAIMSHYHMTGEEALGVINDGFQAGADLNSDMLNKINSMIPAFKNAGVTAEQLVALIAQTRSGIFSDQGLEAIAIGTGRIRQFSDNMKKALQGIGIDAEEMAKKLRGGELTPFDALTQIASKLQEIPPNSQEAGKVMNEVFGKAGKLLSTEMVQGLADMSTNLDEVKGKTGEWGEDMDALREKDEQLNQAVADLFDFTGQGFEHTQMQAKLFVKNGLLRIVEGIQSVVKWMKNVWNSSKAVRLAFVVLANIMHTAWLVSTIPMRIVITGIKTIGELVVSLAKTFGGVKTAIKQSFAGLVDIFAGIKNLDPDQIKRGWETAMKGGLAAVKNFTTGIGNNFNTLFNNIKGYGAGIVSSVTGAFNATRGWADYKFDTSDTYDVPSYSTDVQDITLNEDITLDDTLNDHNKNNTGGNKRGGANKKGGSAPSTTKASVDKKVNELKQLQEQLLKQAQEVERKAQEAERKAQEEKDKLTAEGIHAMYKRRAQEIRAMYDVLPDTEENRAAINKLVNANFAEMDKALGELAKKNKEAADKIEQQAKADAQKLVQTMMDASEDGSRAQLDWQLKLLQMEQEAELATIEGNEELKNAVRLKYAKQMVEAQKQYADAQVQIEMDKYNAIASITGSLAEALGAFGESNKELVILQRTLAVAEVLIAQAVAIANAVKKATTDPTNFTVWQMIAAIGTSVAAVTGAIASAFSSLDGAKFARGGYISGAGTSTSDSIPVRVSNGESVMNANTTAMFSGLLSSLNQLGGGVPIQAQRTASSVRGEDMLARAVAKGVAMLPAPVVSVQDINRGQRQVEVMNERATL